MRSRVLALVSLFADGTFIARSWLQAVTLRLCPALCLLRPRSVSSSVSTVSLKCLKAPAKSSGEVKEGKTSASLTARLGREVPSMLFLLDDVRETDIVEKRRGVGS